MATPKEANLEEDADELKPSVLEDDVIDIPVNLDKPGAEPEVMGIGWTPPPV